MNIPEAELKKLAKQETAPSELCECGFCRWARYAKSTDVITGVTIRVVDEQEEDDI